MDRGRAVRVLDDGGHGRRGGSIDRNSAWEDGHGIGSTRACQPGLRGAQILPARMTMQRIACSWLGQGPQRLALANTMRHAAGIGYRARPAPRWSRAGPSADSQGRRPPLRRRYSGPGATDGSAGVRLCLEYRADRRRNRASCAPLRGISAQARATAQARAMAQPRPTQRNGGAQGTAVSVEWWRWGRIELPVQNTVAENFLQVFPANLRFAMRAPDRRGASLAIR